MTPLLEARGLARDYRTARGFFGSSATVKALAGVSFTLEAGRTLAVVGESGCGKSTLARLLTFIERPTAGAVIIDGEDVAKADKAARRRLRRTIQIVFQNPYGSLNPRQRIGKALEEPLLVNTKMPAREREAAARAIMVKVGLRPEFYSRYPHMFSGGQRQRVAIARALVNRPSIILADEPTGNLDSKTGIEILALFEELYEKGNTLIVVTHEESVARHARRIIRLHDGLIDSDGPVN